MLLSSLRALSGHANANVLLNGDANDDIDAKLQSFYEC